MFRIATTFLLAATLSARAAPLPKDPPKDGKKDAVAAHLEKLAGTWKLEREVRSGEEQTRVIYLRFKGDSITGWEAGGEDKAEPMKFKIDPTKEPAEMDLATPDGTMFWIYEVKGDTLTMARANRKRDPRPTKLESTPESGVTLDVLIKAGPRVVENVPGPADRASHSSVAASASSAATSVFITSRSSTVA